MGDFLSGGQCVWDFHLFLPIIDLYAHDDGDGGVGWVAVVLINMNEISLLATVSMRLICDILRNRIVKQSGVCFIIIILTLKVPDILILKLINSNEYR